MICKLKPNGIVPAALVDNDRAKLLLDRFLHPETSVGHRPPPLPKSPERPAREAAPAKSAPAPEPAPVVAPKSVPKAVASASVPKPKKSDPVLDKALAAAVKKMDLAEVKDLLGKGANPNPDGKNHPFQSAMKQMYEKPEQMAEIAVELLKNGATITTTDFFGLEHSGSRTMDSIIMNNAHRSQKEFTEGLARSRAAKDVCSAALEFIPDTMAQILLEVKDDFSKRRDAISFMAASNSSCASNLPGEAGALIKAEASSSARDQDRSFDCAFPGHRLARFDDDY